MIILGIDSGIRNMGYALINIEKGKISLVDISDAMEVAIIDSQCIRLKKS
ncbi:MAG: hypothetical protein U9N39_02345 [Campylobacterota bacterium]|nr:hypothetical protein [Campylobacterota bacterium]